MNIECKKEGKRMEEVDRREKIMKDKGEKTESAIEDTFFFILRDLFLHEFHSIVTTSYFLRILISHCL